MILDESTLDFQISQSNIGRYETIKLTLDYIDVFKQSDSYKRLTQIEIINKVLGDVLCGFITKKTLVEFNAKMKKKDNKNK
ncbi:MAG: hypothetical protein LBM22_01875 [Endomicrobium sp.]|jgi:hypothetical protein|nr:hypothetical protein [Endomicrobium sp.]